MASLLKVLVFRYKSSYNPQLSEQGSQLLFHLSFEWMKNQMHLGLFRNRGEKTGRVSWGPT